MLINPTAEEISDDTPAKHGLLDYALYVARLDAAVPDTLSGERMEILIRRTRCCVRRRVDDHVAGPFVPAHVRDRADVDWYWRRRSRRR